MGFRLANVGGRAALVHNEEYFDLAEVSNGELPSNPMLALRYPDELSALTATLEGRTASGTLAGVVLGPPVPQPQKSFGIGLNYLVHATESSMELPKNPLVFTKFPSCLTGPTADVEMRSDSCDYEGELVVVIGRGGKDIAPQDAWGHVIGVMAGQDISDRKAQFAAKPHTSTWESRSTHSDRPARCWYRSTRSATPGIFGSLPPSTVKSARTKWCPTWCSTSPR